MKTRTPILLVAVSSLILAGCQSVQLHDHVKEDLNSAGLSSPGSCECTVQLHDYVKEDVQKVKDVFDRNVRLHDHVHQDIEWLKAHESKR